MFEGGVYALCTTTGALNGYSVCSITFNTANIGTGYSNIDHKYGTITAGTGIANCVCNTFTCIRNNTISNTRIVYLNGAFTFSTGQFKNSGVYSFLRATRIA